MEAWEDEDLLLAGPGVDVRVDVVEHPDELAAGEGEVLAGEPVVEAGRMWIVRVLWNSLSCSGRMSVIALAPTCRTMG